MLPPRRMGCGGVHAVFLRPQRWKGGQAGRGTYLAIYHHPQPWQRIAGPRKGPGARTGLSPRPARRTGGRPAAGLMARPPVPAGPGTPRPPPPAPLPLSAPRRRPLGPRLSVPPGLRGSGRGGRGQTRPRPHPARRRCERRASPRALGGWHRPPSRGRTWCASCPRPGARTSLRGPADSACT